MPNRLKNGDTNNQRSPGHEQGAGWFNAYAADLQTGCR